MKPISYNFLKQLVHFIFYFLDEQLKWSAFSNQHLIFTFNLKKKEKIRQKQYAIPSKQKKSATQGRDLPEADETKITGGAIRPVWSTCNVLNLCSVISSAPRTHVGGREMIS